MKSTHMTANATLAAIYLDAWDALELLIQLSHDRFVTTRSVAVKEANSDLRTRRRNVRDSFFGCYQDAET